MKRMIKSFASANARQQENIVAKILEAKVVIAQVNTWAQINATAKVNEND